MSQYNLLGLRLEMVPLQKCNGDDVYYTKIGEKYTFLLERENQNYEFSIYEEQDMCYSGYTTCTYGKRIMTEVKKFGIITHNIKIPGIVDIDDKIYDIKNDYFELSRDGEDRYYPSGYIDINMNMFIDIRKRIMIEGYFTKSLFNKLPRDILKIIYKLI